jgi:large subunit ribosomal protein L21
MSFAIIQTGGKQYKVSASEILKIERLNDEEGKTVEFKKVLFLNDDKTTEIGNPNIEGAKVEATIIKNTKNKTILVFKKRRRKNSRKKYGHRQPISLIRITKIFSKDGKIIAKAEPKKEITRKNVQGDRVRKKQELEAKKVEKDKKTKLKQATKKTTTSAKVGQKEKEKKKSLTTEKK